jgi:hypothetical protein
MRDADQRMILFLKVCAFPHFRQKKAKGWGTEHYRNNENTFRVEKNSRPVH